MYHGLPLGDLEQPRRILSDHFSNRVPREAGAFYQQQEFPKARYGTRPAYQAIADTIEAAVSAALLGEKDVEDVHREAQEALDQIVAEE